MVVVSLFINKLIDHKVIFEKEKIFRKQVIQCKKKKNCSTSTPVNKKIITTYFSHYYVIANVFTALALAQ